MRSTGDVVESILGGGGIFNFARAGFYRLFYSVFKITVEHTSTFKLVQPRRACGARGVVFLIRYNCVVIISN